MNVTAPGKLLVLAVVTVGIICYLISAQWTHADTTPAWASLSLVVGYLVGNGVGAYRGIPSAPVFAPPAPPPSSAGAVPSPAPAERGEDG